MATFETGEVDARGVFYDTAIKQIAKYSYKWKQLVSVVSSSAWKSFFYRESTTIPAGESGNDTRGLPRGADFPNAVVSWEKVQSVIEKYGLEVKIDYEDIVAGEIDMRNRLLLRLAEGIVKAVDTEISLKITENWTPSTIQTGSLTGGYWNETSAAIIKDIATMKAQIKAYYDNAQGFVLVTNPNMEPNVLHYIYEKGAQASESGNSAFNGVVGRPAGVDYMTSSVVPASYAVLLVPKTCGTWKELVALGTDTESKKFKGDTITACEMGVTELHEPKQVVVIKVLE
jgi:hypothetical protein